MIKFDITTSDHRIDVEKRDWIRTTFDESEYKITNDGWLIDSYSVTFKDEKSAFVYRLMWDK